MSFLARRTHYDKQRPLLSLQLVMLWTVVLLVVVVLVSSCSISQSGVPLVGTVEATTTTTPGGGTTPTSTRQWPSFRRTPKSAGLFTATSLITGRRVKDENSKSPASDTTTTTTTLIGNTTATTATSNNVTTTTTGIVPVSESLSSSIKSFTHNLHIVRDQVHNSVISIGSSGISVTKHVLTSNELQLFVAVMVGTLLTFVLNNNNNDNFPPIPFITTPNMNPILSSSIVGLLCSLLLLAIPSPNSTTTMTSHNNNLSIAAFCGSFAGMATISVISTVWPDAVSMGMICAILLMLFDQQKLFVGVGGRLGFIAQCSCTIQYIVSSFLQSRHRVAAGYDSASASTSTASLIASNIVIPPPKKLLSQLAISSLFIIVGALMMTYIKDTFSNLSLNASSSSSKNIGGVGIDDDKKKNNVWQQSKYLHLLYRCLSSSVASVSITGIISSLLLPNSMAGPIYCGSFIAMSSPNVLKTYGSMIVASMIAGILHVTMSEAVLVGGWGGKLGTTAFLGVITFKVLQNLEVTLKGMKSSYSSSMPSDKSISSSTPIAS